MRDKKPVEEEKIKKRENEIRHLNKFRNLFPLFPNQEFLHDDKPDFLVLTTTHLLGIEHSEVLIDDNYKMQLRAKESQQEDIISKAQQEYAKLRKTPPVKVIFGFGNYTLMEIKDRLALAKTIACYVHNAVGEITDPKQSKNVEIPKANIPEELRYATISILKEGSKHFWRCNRSGWVVEDCRELLQKTIDKKNEKFNNYMEKCQECWLLLVADLKPSSFISPNQETLDYEFTSRFARTFFLDLGEGILHQLKTKEF